jgi:hypothetical protein
MRYTIVLLLLLSGTAASNAGTLLEGLRLAQNRTFAECVSNCNSDNFSCAQNCGLSGACVAQCTAAPMRSRLIASSSAINSGYSAVPASSNSGIQLSASVFSSILHSQGQFQTSSRRQS